MKISEIKRGCGKGYLKLTGDYQGFCGKDNYLCQTCQAKLTQAIEDTKEEIEFLKSISKRDYRNVNKTMEQVDERIKQKEAEIK